MNRATSHDREPQTEAITRTRVVRAHSSATWESPPIPALPPERRSRNDSRKQRGQPSHSRTTHRGYATRRKSGERMLGSKNGIPAVTTKLSRFSDISHSTSQSSSPPLTAHTLEQPPVTRASRSSGRSTSASFHFLSLDDQQFFIEVARPTLWNASSSAIQPTPPVRVGLNRRQPKMLLLITACMA